MVTNTRAGHVGTLGDVAWRGAARRGAAWPCIIYIYSVHHIYTK